MNASLFMLLPVEDAVLNIPQTNEAWNELFAPLLQVKEFARKKGIELRIFYDQENIAQFKADAGVVVDDGSYLEKPSKILQHFIGSNSSDVQKVKLLDVDCSYIRWDSRTCTMDVDTPLVVKNAFESHGSSCVLSLSSKIPADYYQVSLIKERSFCVNLPKLKNIPLFFSADECVEWLSSLLEGHFSLIGNNAFIRTSYYWNNQCIFKKVEDGTYWYFDFFHRENKIHYEVYDATGKHIGVTSEDGQLIEGTADKDKSISRILHGR